MGALAETRERNRLSLLNALRDATVADRNELARLTGLSRTTVSSLAADLIARGAVTESLDPDTAGEPGRPSGLLRLDPRAAAVVGIDCGHRYFRVAIADLAGNVLAERRRDFDVYAGAGAAFDATAATVESLLAEARVDHARLLGAAICFPAPVDPDTGELGPSAALSGWQPVMPREELRSRLGIPIATANDADLGALGELVYGAGRELANVLYIKLSSGIGGGLIIDGELHTAGIAGEIGHVGVDPEGVICRCGNRGCLETVASADVIRARLAAQSGEAMSLRRLLALAEEGDRTVVAELARAGTRVGEAFAGLCTALDPDTVLIGGEFGAGCEPLRDAIAAQFRTHVPEPVNHVPVLRAELGPRAEMLGAIALALAQTGWLRDAGLVSLLDTLPREPV